jgi:hypothetical protein
MNCHYACGSVEHRIARRGFLGLAAAGLGGIAGGLGIFTRSVFAEALTRDQKRIIVFNMHGGLSQLESWDPKPRTDTGGPFRAIPTSVPGIHISELLPETAKQMHHLCLVRGVNTSEDDHAKGTFMMLTGRRQTPGANFPQIGAVAAKALAESDNPLPGHILITPNGGGRGNEAAYLGPKYSSVVLGNGNPPAYMDRPGSIAEDADAARQTFRRKVNAAFLDRRRTAVTDAYTQSYESALQLMTQKEAFDVSKEPERDHDRYGREDFGRQCLLARRLLERGVPFVQVTHSNYDTHNENFDFHWEQMGEFDRPFASLVADIADRGMLEGTLIVVLSEFGRTPHINDRYGRDHWSRSWTVVLGGGRVARGAAFGKTNENGTEVVDGQVDHGNLFHTYLQAVGVDSAGTFNLGGREVPVADPATHPIDQVLA